MAAGTVLVFSGVGGQGTHMLLFLPRFSGLSGITFDFAEQVRVERMHDSLLLRAGKKGWQRTKNRNQDPGEKPSKKEG